MHSLMVDVTALAAARRSVLWNTGWKMLILKAVSLGPLHGYGILLRIQQISGERLEILQGSFYIAIYRLERRGWIKGKWGESENVPCGSSTGFVKGLSYLG